MFDDGRMNVVVEGHERFRLRELTSGRDVPHRRGRAGRRRGRRARRAGRRRARDRRCSAGSSRRSARTSTSRTAASGSLSFEIAARVDFGTEPKQELLELRSEPARLGQLCDAARGRDRGRSSASARSGSAQRRTARSRTAERREAWPPCGRPAGTARHPHPGWGCSSTRHPRSSVPRKCCDASVPQVCRLCDSLVHSRPRGMSTASGLVDPVRHQDRVDEPAAAAVVARGGSPRGRSRTSRTARSPARCAGRRAARASARAPRAPTRRPASSSARADAAAAVPGRDHQAEVGDVEARRVRIARDRESPDDLAVRPRRRRRPRAGGAGAPSGSAARRRRRARSRRRSASLPARRRPSCASATSAARVRPARRRGRRARLIRRPRRGRPGAGRRRRRGCRRSRRSTAAAPPKKRFRRRQRTTS